MIFEDIQEFIIDTPYNHHRRRDSFYRISIVEFTEDEAKHFPEIADFTPYLGTWKTNTYTWSDDYGIENDAICELTKVEKKVEMVETTYWEAI